MKKRDMEFLYEMGTLRFIPRAWKQFLGTDFSNLAEHTLRVIWLATMISKNEKNINLDKVIKMALVHDITESRTGDVHYISRQYTERHEDQALKDMLKDTSIEKEFGELWKEYEERQTLEAKIVKDADNLDVEMELKEQAAKGNSLYKKWRPAREKSIPPKIFTKTALKLLRAVHEADPDDWHINAPNRFSVGDWKKK